MYLHFFAFRILYSQRQLFRPLGGRQLKRSVERQDYWCYGENKVVADNRLHILPHRSRHQLHCFFLAKQWNLNVCYCMLLISLQVLEWINHVAWSDTIINCFSLNHSLRPRLKNSFPYEAGNDNKVWLWLLASSKKDSHQGETDKSVSGDIRQIHKTKIYRYI